MKNKHIAVWFSCGAASAVAAHQTLKKYGDENKVSILNNRIANEDEDNRRFLKDVEQWLGVEIIQVQNPKFPAGDVNQVFQQIRYMSGISGASCTLHLKKRARQLWENENKPDHTVLGFTIDEKARHDRFVETERNLLPVLIDARITKQDCVHILQSHGIDLPRVYKMGLPNANCIGCVKAQSPTYWNFIRKHWPEVYEERVQTSKELGVRLARHKGERVFLHDLPIDAKGAPLKSLDFECGLFCEEYKEI